MATNQLTDVQCRKIKPGEKVIKLFDGGGLHLFVTPKGAKIWRIAFRINGKPQLKSLGAYPLLSLAEAREKREQIKNELLNGSDPRKKTGKQNTSLAEAVDQYWDGRKDLTPKYIENAKNGIKHHLAKLLEIPIASINKDLLLEELLEMDRKGLYVYVRKVKVWVGLVFDWAVAVGVVQNNPTHLIDSKKAFGKALVENHASLPLADVGDFMKRLDYEQGLQSVLACKLLALTWVRTVELRLMRWSEIDGNIWRIPKERMKKRKDHVVPLSKQALELIGQLRNLNSISEYVFPGDRDTKRPMSENSILYLIGRIGYKGKMTGHGWRSIGSTWANESGYSSDAIERQLAHSPEDKVRAVYNKAEYLPERTKMLQEWADWLDQQII